MRLALVSLIAVATGAAAYAQSTGQMPAPSAPPAPPAVTEQTAQPASNAMAPASPAPAATDSNAASNAAAPPPSPPPPPPAPPPPPPPPAPPTDPTAIAVLNAVQHVCIPAVNGTGKLPQLAKSAGYRKNDDNNWVLRTRDFTMTIDDLGANPNQCHIDLTHPLDVDSPGKPIIIALNDWVGIENGWSLYRNDKSVQGTMQFTTRSWQHSADGKDESLVFTTMRKPDGTPIHNNVDTSQIIYEVDKSAN